MPPLRSICCAAVLPLAVACLLCGAWQGLLPLGTAALVAAVILSAAVLALAAMLVRLRKTQAALKQSEAMFRNLFEQAAVGAAQLNREGRFVQVNSKYCNLLGRSREELLQLTFRDLTHPGDLPRAVAGFERLLRGEIREVSVEKRYLRKDGATVQCAMSVAAFSPEGGPPQAFILIVQDIAALQEAHQQEVQAERLQAVGQLSSGIAHEFNNLLMIILGYTELLKLQNSANVEVAQACDTIGAQVLRGRNIISQLMALASPAPGRMEVFRVAELVEQVLDTQKSLLSAEQIQIVREISGDPCIRADRFLLQQVLINLIVNARHAITPKGSGVITLRASQSEGRVRIDVQDNGCGMDEDTKKKVFTPFFSTKGAFSHNSLGIKGAGLGLAICLKIIQGHRGDITFASEPGKGARFTISLPTAEMGGAAQRPPAALVSSVAPGREPRLLVVDDEPDLCNVIKAILARCGCRDVECVNSGREAMERLEAGPYDLVFIDLIMPGMSGPDLVHAARAKAIPLRFVFISGQMDVTEAELEALGAAGVLRKPFGAKQLRRLLAEVLPASQPGPQH